ncbi:hypothetical protein ACA910_014228 [Epithemia clementina (nom. ined.)]
MTRETTRTGTSLHTSEEQKLKQQSDINRKYGSSPTSSDSEDEKRTNSTVEMDDEGNSVGPDYQADYHALENISLAETASDQNDEDNDLFETGSNPSEFLAQRETRAVSWLRVTVLTVMAVTTVIVSATVYYTRTCAQQKAFSIAFQDASSKMLDSFESNWKLRWQAVGSLAIDLTSFAEHAGNVSGIWPTVTFPDFPQRAAPTLSMADSSSISILPIVQDDHRDLWQHYVPDHAKWLQEEDPEPEPSSPSRHFLSSIMGGHSAQRRETSSLSPLSQVSDHIFNFGGPAKDGTGPYAPLWQTHPIADNLSSWVNMDLLSVKKLDGLHRAIQTQQIVLEQVSNIVSDESEDPDPVSWPQLMEALRGKPDSSYSEEPFSPMFYPLIRRPLNGGEQSRVVVSVLMSIVYWRLCFEHVLQPSEKSITVVIHNDCQQSFSYRVEGQHAQYLGQGDWHDDRFDHLAQTVKLSKDLLSTSHAGLSAHFDEDYCTYSLSLFPTYEMKEKFITKEPVWSTLVVVLVFSLACAVFFIYDFLVERRQKVVMDQAMQSTAIVSSLFPEAVRDRLFNEGAGEDGETHRGARNSITGANHLMNRDIENDYGIDSSDAVVSSSVVFEPASKSIKSFLTDAGTAVGGSPALNKPIADLFPHCTVLFADIAGFTAWSSLREPTQVFTLLENIYHTFDQIARKRGVFKVETVGDSYVAVTGLPDPQEDHALVMAKFARDCRTKMNEVTRKLELTLGPDTGDLSMRFGLHSGPVTAGVLRGERSRFQLFGDTVNTAARMESTGERDRIQCSQATADLICAKGKGHWLRVRENKVHAKGKGELQTYWIEIKSAPKDQKRRNSDNSQFSGDTIHEKNSVIWGSEEEIPEAVTQRAKHQRLIDYNVDLLMHHLRRIVARRNALLMAGRRCSQGGLPPVIHEPSTEVKDRMVLDEVTEVIRLPQYDATAVKGYVDPDTIELPPKVVSQLKRYVSVIGAMYRQNPFHNFEHASHVVMSVNKLLQRVTTPNIDLTTSQNIASDLHTYTYGITSDAITQFAVVFSALIHDVDHWGVSNQQLEKEGAPMAKKYKMKSIAEQNSVDLAWDLLMDPDEYGDLQKFIFTTDAEYKRFRQVVVNLVMATDIFDKELGELRKNRWAKAFSTDNDGGYDPDDEHRKATIVIEHIMQASDVAHTMQHWHVYQKWNRRLFDELYTAWRAGRMAKDPSTFWYDGEIKFFDSYVIPLAKKLKECGVFGVASDECLNYAECNRKEWESKGQMIVTELLANYEQRDKEELQRVSRAGLDTTGGVTDKPSSMKKRKPFMRRRSLITTGG